MNVDETENDVDIDLDSFSNEFFGTEQPKEKEEEVVETEEDNSLATDDDDENVEDSPAEEEETENDDDNDEDEEEVVEEVPQPKDNKKRNRAQERIEKLVAEARQAERERDALRIELERLRTETKEAKTEDEAPTLREQLPADAPNPDAKDKDGNAVYELGEFDPRFIRDLTKFTIEQETKAAKERAEQEEFQAQMEAARQEITAKWNDNLSKAEEEIPELRDNIHDLVDTFKDIEPNYGEYLASTIMASDYGPQIMNYLSQNIGEAQKIVASGPAAATLALGRLEARFVTSTQQEEKRNEKRVSEAPPPPQERARGRHGQFEVADDTDNLDAFERKFFQKR